MRTKAVSFLVFALTLSSVGAVRGNEPTKDEPLKLVSVEVEPSEIVLDGRWSSHALLITGQFSDGTVRDLTSEAELKPADAAVVRIDQAGTITPVADGETTISVVAKVGDSSVDAEAHVTVKNSADDSTYFLRDVIPLISHLGCNTAQCHGSATGKGGLKLSMFGADPGLDFESLTRSAEGRRINRVEPAKSLFLLKATASIEHKGGQIVQPDSVQYRMLASWVVQGARLDAEQGPELVSIEVLPEKHVFRKGDTRRLLATAIFSDGTRRDATPYAFFQSSETEVATVDRAGQVKVDGYGQATIIVSYMRRFAVVRIVVPQPLSSPFPEVAANNEIDELVFAKLKELGIPPSETCSDPVFLRRVYLDVTGTLPTVDEARAFHADTDPQKRSKLIDRLLESGEFADFWALKWGDLFRVKSEYPSNLWPNAVQAFHRWVRDSIFNDKPYDQFAKELITASGSNFRSPPANYYRAFLKREPQNLSEVTALVFMGARVGCARCHAHPSEEWTFDDGVRMAAFFAQVKYKATREWKEEIVYINPRQTMRHPRTSEVVVPKFLSGDVPELAEGEDPRARFAQWLIAPENPWFARNIVNRVWFWLLGRGIVHEPDDLRSTNLPENEALLEYLEKELVSNQYDLKHVYRLILNSRTYQLSSKTHQFNQNDVAHFSHYQPKRLGAETLLDAIGQVTERWDTYRSRIPEPFVVMPQAYRATHLADGSIDLPFLQLFGRPPRDTAYESDRDLNLFMRQTLHLLNSSDVQNKINASARVRRLINEVKEDPKVIEELYLATLSRYPTEEDGKRIADYMAGKGKTVPQEVEAAKEAADEVLAKIRQRLQDANAQYEAADKAAKDAEAAAARAKAAVPVAVAAQTNAQNDANSKRRQADEAKKKLDDLNANPPPSADTVAAATSAYQAADKAAGEAATVAENAKADADKARTAQTVSEKAAAENRKSADEAKVARDKLVADDKAAAAKVAEADRKFNAAKAALKPRRDHAIQDLLWALFNTKEFVFNH